MTVGLTLLPAQANPAILWVNDDEATPVPPGASCTNAGFTTIQSAVNSAAVPGGEQGRSVTHRGSGDGREWGLMFLMRPARPLRGRGPGGGTESDRGQVVAALSGARGYMTARREMEGHSHG
jgi:hypothetical protein